MASFEFPRIAAVTEIARDLGASKLAPLYLAALVAGGGMGIGIVLATSQGSEGVSPPAVTAPVASAASLDYGFVEMPPAPVVDPVQEALRQGIVELPAEFNSAMAPPVIPAPPVQPAPENVEPIVPAPVVPVAPAPVAPAPVVPAPVAPAPVAPAPPVVQQPPPQPQPAPTAAPEPEPSNFYVPAVSGGPATNMEQRLLNGINAERAKAGLAPYSYDAGLTRIARTRVQQMVDQGYFAHTDPYGYTMYVELLAYFGYGYSWAGENLALNNYAASESPERALISLMNSSTHRANLLATKFNRIGIGELTTADGRHFYAMIFLG